MQFQFSDVPRIMPELLLSIWGLLVLLFDVFTRWRSGAEGERERAHEAGTMTLLGLGVIFLLVFLQGGYLIDLPADAATANMVERFLINLRAGGAQGTLLGNAFVVDNLTHLARLTFIGAAIITVMLTLNQRPSGNPGEFYSLILFSTVGMCFMAAAGNLILIYLAIELTSIPLYILAGYFRSDRRSTEAGMKYFLFGALSSAILLYGMSLVFGLTGSTDLVSAEGATPGIAQQLQSQIAADGSPSALLLIGLIFIIAGMGYKTAVVPFHSWAPDVYQGAPTTITAFISTASKMAGFLVLLRMLTSGFGLVAGSAALGPQFNGWASMLVVVAFLTLLFGNLAALPQSNAKRLLAYSSIGHAGFLLLGMLGGSSVAAMLYYLVVYTLTNLGAFGLLAIVSDQLGGDEISDLNGLGRRSPLLAMLMTILILSLAGVPPLSGFWAKFMIFMAGWESGARWLVIVAVALTMVSLYYYLRLLKAIYIAEPTDNDVVVRAPGWSSIALAITVGLVFLLGLFPQVVMGVLEQAALQVAAR